MTEMEGGLGGGMDDILSAQITSEALAELRSKQWKAREEAEVEDNFARECIHQMFEFSHKMDRSRVFLAVNAAGVGVLMKTV